MSPIQADRSAPEAVTAGDWLRLLGGDGGRVSEASVELLIETADAHGVTELLCAAPGQTNPCLAAALQARAHAAIAREALVGVELARVLDVLAAHRVHALVFKGTALAYTLYAQPWLRPRADTDLLIDPAERDRARHALEAAGYRQTDALTSGSLVSHQVAFVAPAEARVDVVIDLHWKVVNPQLLAGVVAPSDMLADAIRVPRLGSQVQAPGLAHAALLACLHRVAHHRGHDRLVWLHDLHLLASAMDEREWERLAGIAETRQVAGIVLDGFVAAQRSFGTRLPDPVADRLGRAAPTEPSRRFVEGPMARRDVLASDLAALPGWRARGRLLVEHAFPPAAFMRSRYGGRGAAWLPALYVHRLVTGAFKWLRA